MAVLIEGYSVVINKAQAMKNQEALSALTAVEGTLHPLAICADNELLRIGFMEITHAYEFVAALENAGLKFRTDVNGEEIAQDFALVTQFGEMEVSCPWLDVQFTKMKNGTLICLGAMKGAENKGVAFPKHWSRQESILKRYYETRIAHMDTHYEKVGEELLHDIFRHKETGETVRLMKFAVDVSEDETVQ